MTGLTTGIKTKPNERMCIKKGVALLLELLDDDLEGLDVLELVARLSPLYGSGEFVGPLERRDGDELAHAPDDVPGRREVFLGALVRKEGLVRGLATLFLLLLVLRLVALVLPLLGIVLFGLFLGLRRLLTRRDALLGDERQRRGDRVEDARGGLGRQLFILFRSEQILGHRKAHQVVEKVGGVRGATRRA